MLDTRVTPLCGQALAALALLVGCALPGRAEQATGTVELPPISVIGTTPLRSSGVPLRDVPANVQILGGEELRRQPTSRLTDLLNLGADSVGLNAAQGNADQVDVVFRGFSASPLLGTPQGISVFVDGVRINELFGDTVNWDLIPRAAIARVELIPGSNPAFGLNTLGGALAISTKSGADEYPDHPGGAVTLGGGSFHHRLAEVETGGHRGAWDWFVTAHHHADQGWASHNSSRVGQAFSKLGWRDAGSHLDATLSVADTHLEGLQTLPVSFGDLREPYTHPDLNRNRAVALALTASHALSETLLLSATAHGRQFRNHNVSSNVADLGDAGNGSPAVNDASSIEQGSGGVGVQVTSSAPLAGMRNRLTVGIGLDGGSARFQRSAQPAAFTEDRGTVPTGAFELDTDAQSKTRYAGLFVSDLLQLDPRWTLALGARIHRADVSITDRSGSEPGLNGAHGFTHVGPALGLTFNPTPRLTVFSSYSEGMRAPTAIELTCADPTAPCKLPNSFLADPPLSKVLSRTFELGARGRPQVDAQWSAALFRTDLLGDLQFVGSSEQASNTGYFQNVGRTRRQGVELGGRLRRGPVQAALHYTYLDARYLDGFVESSPNNSTADASGAIVVTPGNRIPGLARHTLKLQGELDMPGDTQVGLSLVLASSLRARGDENNRDVHGSVPGYAVVNLDVRRQVTPVIEMFGRVDNLFDRRYANFGILGNNVFTGPGRTYDPANARQEQFRGQAAPRSIFIGVRYAFGAPS